MLKDTGNIIAFSSANEYGKDTFGSPGTAFGCRFESDAGKRVVTSTGEEALIDGFVYMPSSITVTEKDRIQLNGVTYRIMSLKLDAAYTSNHHYKVGVRRA